jgi:glutamyl-Q tRNA(Asp) synthetase
MAGLVPAIHVFVDGKQPNHFGGAKALEFCCAGLRSSLTDVDHAALLQDVDARDKPGHDGVRLMPPPVFRFAPSPNGYLHLGHAFSAMLNADLARELGGRFLLRIEDIDPTRCRVEFEEAIVQDLAWLGLCWEKPVRRQSEHFSEYRLALEKLMAMGLVYPAFESRTEIARLIAEREKEEPWPRDPDGAPLYPGIARALSPEERARRLQSGAPYALRLDMTAACRRVAALGWVERGEGPDGETGTVAAHPTAWGDIIIARKETPTSYHLAVVVDDALQGVSEVVRGQDLFWSTSVHRLLQELLGLPQPIYRHHRLIRDAAGQKLSKSTEATGLRELRVAGVTPAEIRRRVGLGQDQ